MTAAAIMAALAIAAWEPLGTRAGGVTIDVSEDAADDATGPIRTVRLRSTDAATPTTPTERTLQFRCATGEWRLRRTRSYTTTGSLIADVPVPPGRWKPRSRAPIVVAALARACGDPRQ